MTVCQSLVLFSVIYLVQVTGNYIKRGFCDDINPDDWHLGQKFKDINFKSALIFEGTKWCGKSNIAESYNDLGWREDLDKCCRAHDGCEPSIMGGRTEYGIENTSFDTWKSCDCNDEFRQCLKKLKDFAADVIGVFFFDISHNKCIYEDYPQKCEKFLFFDVKCKDDTTRGKIWQSKLIDIRY